MHYQEETIEERLRRQALTRITDYTHPEINLTHQPINARECEELQAQLRELVRQKVEQVRREYEAKKFDHQYDEVYSEFVRMTSVNEAQRQTVCKNIREMHQMADILKHPPSFKGELYLSSNKSPTPLEVEQFNQLYQHYEKMHKSGHQLQQNEVQETIKMAKNFYLRERS